MEKLTMPPEIAEMLKSQNSPELCDYSQWRVDRANSIPGKLTGVNCPKCLNRGHSTFLVDGQEVIRECDCMKARRSIKLIEESGLKGTLDDYTFDTYQCRNEWQKQVKDSAMNFVHDSGKWFFIGGNSGSGKTHICTAICGEFLRQNRNVRYMVWVTDIRQLKANVNDDEYDRIFNRFANADVLYIDDLFKVKQGADLSPSDVQRTYELINYRYVHKDLPTIISSEKFIDDIVSIDEATGSRIYSLTKEYRLEVNRDQGKNWRLHDA